MQDDTTVQHRFVQIHQTCALTPERKDQLWSVLARPGLSSIAVSNACQKTVEAVKNEILGFQYTLQQFQNLVLTSQCRLKTTIFLRSITRILLYHVENPKLHAAVQLVHSNSLPGTLHPFVVILRQRPQLYHDLLYELDFIMTLEDIDDVSLFQTMVPFYDAIFLLDFSVNEAPLLTRIATMMTKNSLTTHLFDYLCGLVDRYPTQRAFESYLALIDVVITYVISSPTLHEACSEEAMKEVTTGLIYHLITRACDAATYDRPMLPYLERIPQLLDSLDLCNDKPMANVDPHLLWTFLSYVLLKAQTMDDQEIVLAMMQNQLNQGFRSSLLLIAYLPLFQTLSEVTNKESSIKSQVLDLLTIIAKEEANPPQDSLNIVEKIVGDVNRYPITGVLAHSVIFLLRFLEGKGYGGICLEQRSTASSVTYIHRLLFCIPSMFSSDTSVRHASLSQVTELVSFLEGTSYKFPTLLLLLHLMRHSVTTSDTLLYILHHVFPPLIDRNDPTTTSKVLQIVLSMISGDTAMSNLGVKVLMKIHDRHPRVWPELKKVLADWVLRRKSATARYSIEPLALQVELTMLTTMRDLCRQRPRECAQDVLPMLLSILQTCQDLSIASLAIIVQAVCACVTAGMAEPRSIWIVAIQYIAQHAMVMDSNVSPVLLQRLCDFFVIVGDKDEVSDPYVEFKETVLKDYLGPLMESSNSKVQSAALKALSHFSAADIMMLLPEKAKDFLGQMTSSEEPNQAYSVVLVNLMSHELDHMRRGLFQEEVSKKKQEKEMTTNRKISVGDKEHFLGGQFISHWENARTMPGLRTGYALAILTAAHGYIDRATGANTMEAIAKTKLYRCMTTSIADIGLTDYLLIRVTSLGAWMTFFQSMFVGNEGDIEAKASLLLNDLLARLEKSTVPGTTSNLLLAIGGLITTAYQIIPAFATSCGTQFIDTLIDRYIMADSVSTALMSDEVQFAARFVLGHVAQCVIVNEKNATKVLEVLLKNVGKSLVSSRNIDVAVDLVHFANGYAAGRYTASLATWPTKSERIDSLAQQGLNSLLEHCNAANQTTSEATLLGMLMGWASLMDRTDMKEVFWFAREMLKLFTEGKKINKGIVLGVTWICSFAALASDGQIDEEVVNLLESASTTAANDNTLAQHFYHFSVPLAKVARARLITEDSLYESSDSYTDLLLADLQIIQHETESSNRRLAALFSLSTLLGVDYLNTPPNPEWITIEARKYSAETRNPILDALASAAGLTEPVGNLKSGRIAAVVSGKVVQAAMAMQEALRLEQVQLGASGPSAVLVAAMSSEPKTYARLNHNTSYLRAVFEGCVALTEAPDQPHAPSIANLFLTSLRETPGPLPPVNWFTVLVNLAKISPAIQSECILFASTHAGASASLLEFVLLQVGQAARGVREDLQKLLLGEAGLGKMLELSGLPAYDAKAKSKRRGMDAVTKKMSVSEMRCLELFEAFAKSFKGWSLEIQLVFLSTLSNHLRRSGAVDESKVSLISSLQSMTMYNVTLPLLGRADLQYQENYAIVVRKAVECGINEMGQLNENMQTWLKPETAYGQVVAVTEVCRLGRTDMVPKYLTEVMTQLLRAGVEDTMTWGVLAEAIKYHARTVHDRFGWVVRLLDVLIVIGSLGLEQGEIMLQHGITLALRRMLTVLWWSDWMNSEEAHSPKLKKMIAVDLADTDYMLAHVIYLANDYPQPQQQIVKRIFKLLELATEHEQKQFFLRVLRDCPEQAIKEEHQMAKWISCD
ncbi:hypothetical protein EC973_000818 [Apophysomyces ossiformis]|uniref:DUF3730 domain-containing protein n=1 Tax=Apophysomyces ossiformis TaxID=679940 RepID=A0A8H7ESD8_9FUNG|nr:hypothetical protein EC973_000818 [Apophysomyces ossiformis]